MEVGTRASQISKGMSQEAATLLSMDANGVRGGSSLPAAMTMAPSSTSLDASLVASPAFLPVYSIPPGQVMTDEQLETLRRQISVYATICQQLVEMHKAIMAQQSTMQGLRLGQSIPFDAAFHSGHKLTSRQRWTPSQTQLQILEKLFEQGNGTPSKQRIKEITMELSQHGQISETNVYNWFQNRRARTKRKQQVGGSNNGESELDTDVDSPEEKKTKTERDFSNETLGGAHGETNFQGASISEYHQFEAQRGFLQASQMHMQLDNSALNFKKSSINSQGYNVSEGGFLVDQKPWDVSAHMRDNKTDVVVSSASQESQGQMFTVNGSGQSLSLLPNAENYSMAQ